jgi:hypothetical protein
LTLDFAREEKRNYKMKKYLCLIAIAALLLAGSLVLNTQASMRMSVSANIPFDFYVANSKLSAGEYSISETNSGTSVLLIQKKEGVDAAYVLAVGATPKSSRDSSKLVFNKYNEDYFLSKIWEPGGETGHDISPSKKEQELGKTISENAKKHSPHFQTVAVALK